MSQEKKMLIIGASGHGKVVLSTALAQGETVFGWLDDNPSLFNKIISGYQVIGDATQLMSISDCNAVIGVGANAIRHKIAIQQSQFKHWKALVHPTAYVHPSVEIGEGSVVFAGAVIQPDTKIGKHVIINTGATVDHDCVIGDYAHLAPGVHLAGNVTVGEGVFMGIGSVAIPGMSIGDWAIVAAGGVVVHHIQARKTVMGMPAKERVSC